MVSITGVNINYEDDKKLTLLFDSDLKPNGQNDENSNSYSNSTTAMKTIISVCKTSYRQKSTKIDQLGIHVFI